jgi:hypothetical protein
LGPLSIQGPGLANGYGTYRPERRTRLRILLSTEVLPNLQ